MESIRRKETQRKYLHKREKTVDVTCFPSPTSRQVFAVTVKVGALLSVLTTSFHYSVGWQFFVLVNKSLNPCSTLTRLTRLTDVSLQSWA
jgi:hypothetical protein